MSIQFTANKPTHASKSAGEISGSLHHIQRMLNEEFSANPLTSQEVERIKGFMRRWLGKDRFLLSKALDMVYCSRKFNFGPMWWEEVR